MNIVVLAVGALLAICGGVGVALMIIASTLSASNDVGGNTYDVKDYNIKMEYGGIVSADWYSDRSGFLKSASKKLKKKYEPDPKETVHIMTKEELESIKADPDMIKEGLDFDEDLPPVDGPLFKPLE